MKKATGISTIFTPINHYTKIECIYLHRQNHCGLFCSSTEQAIIEKESKLLIGPKVTQTGHKIN